ncbi:hypothetical protein MMC22_010581 [Lobaria immixta]|nr:hypothetical protein [Lobaria immixta]
MILRRTLRFAESKCPGRLFSSHGNTPGASGQSSNSKENRPDLHDHLKWVRNQQYLNAEARTANIKTVQALEERNRTAKRADGLQRLRTSNWKRGDVYAPHDLGPVEMGKRLNIRMPNQDAFDVLGINPLHEYKNPSIMWEYMAPMGNIKHRKQTRLRPVNQRRISKAIRRAIGMGLIPSVHPHPEMLEAAASKREQLALNEAEGFHR